MSSRDSAGDPRGDAGASAPGAAKSTGAPLSPRSPLPESRAVRDLGFGRWRMRARMRKIYRSSGRGRRKSSAPLDLARRRSRWVTSSLRRGFMCSLLSPGRRSDGEFVLLLGDGRLGSGELRCARARSQDPDLDLPRVGLIVRVDRRSSPSPVWLMLLSPSSLWSHPSLGRRRAA
jgi:hypothetical protein